MIVLRHTSDWDVDLACNRAVRQSRADSCDGRGLGGKGTVTVVLPVRAVVAAWARTVVVSA